MDAALRQAMQRAFHFLAHRPRSLLEVRDHLLRRFPPEVVASALVQLQEQGLLDDHAFARTWVCSRLTHRPRSTSLIAREMADKGVSQETIESALVGADDEMAAYQAIRKLKRRLQESDSWEFHRRGWQFLHRRGFSSPVIRHTLNRLWEEHSGRTSPGDEPGPAL